MLLEVGVHFPRARHPCRECGNFTRLELDALASVRGDRHLALDDVASLRVAVCPRKFARLRKAGRDVGVDWCIR